AAGLATLALMDDAAYSRLDATADRVSAMADAALESAGVPHRINKVSNLFSVFLTDAPVTDFASASKQDTKAFSRFFHAALDAGLWLAPSGFEAWFCSTALDDDDLEVIDAGLHKAAQAAAQGLSWLIPIGGVGVGV
ncbi:aspartate aminotransferase family protein, partial [Propionibacterium freudenreichii]|nr:aspartate aminotransferase family protein [Propionibacterium freudenreichii]